MDAIRPVRPYDLPGAYRVCVMTGDSGADGSALFRNPDLLGHVYVGAYVLGSPAFGFVIDGDRGISGYLLATPDTRAFEAWMEQNWWPALSAHLPRPDPSAAPDGLRDAELIEVIHAPEAAPETVVGRFPAHLHIDLLPRVQGAGLGRALIERTLSELRAQGSPGVHLGVGADNANAIAFYQHLGFDLIERGIDVYYLGMTL